MIRVLLIYVLHRQQGLLEGGGAVGALAVGEGPPRLDGVAEADLPGGDAHFFRQQVDVGLQGELTLAHAEAPEGAGRGVVGVPAEAADVGVLVAVGAHRVGAGPLQHRPAQGGIGPSVEVDLAVQAGEDAVLVAAQGEGALHIVALGVEVDGLLPGELCLHGPVHPEGGQHRQVLHRHVLLAAEAAPHQLVLHHDALGLPPQHDGDLLAGVVHPLVGGIDLHPVLVGEGHGALRLQEGVLGEGGAVGLGHHVLGLGQGGPGVAPGDVALLAQVAAGVEDGGVRRPGLLDGAHRLQGLIVHLHQLLGLLEHGLIFRHHQADGVPHAAGDVPLGDHHVPVLLEVAHLVVGHVVGGEDGQHPRQSQSGGGVDVQHPGSGVLGADGGGVRHAVQVQIVAVLPPAQHLVAHVGAEGPRPHAVVLPLLQGGIDGRLPAEDGPGQGNALDDFLVAGAAAHVAPDGLFDLRLGGVGVLIQQGLARHYHAGDAEAALNRAHRAEGVDEGLPLGLREALHRHDLLACGPLGGQDAGLDGLAVHQDGAGAAGALAAPVLHRGQAQLVPQVAQQRLLLLRGAGDAVDHKGITLTHGRFLIS